ncbi:hypothetical protein LZP85_04070 [Priestia flexa]|uniref:capsular polysaccharide export protein, LipB/KpsS family n=1 Tax=Priestia flexa TaxID=86664 RepID=UPI001F1D68F3|nr:hypothetical protein [Priestia flexa]UIR30976.1 hypothetical protein LZP85_04070 [Priestia flexa]
MSKRCLFVHAHEPDKAIFFSSISKFLNEKKYNSKHLVFNRVEQAVYDECGINNTIFMPKSLKNMSTDLDKFDQKKYDLNDLLHYTLEFNNLNNFLYDKEELFNNAKRYINYLNLVHKTEPLDLIISWNNTFMFDSLAKAFARVNNIPTLFFEAGIFRPHTITVDSKGVNYGNSVAQDIDFYRNVNSDTVRLNNFLHQIEHPEELYKPVKYNNLSKKSRKFLLQRAYDVFNCQILKRELNLNIIYEPFTDKVKRQLSKGFNSLKRNKMKERTKLPDKFIFIPFQVHDDSQVILNSKKINDMDSLVELVIDKVQQYNSKYEENFHVVFKEHPADKNNIHYEKLYNRFKELRNVMFLTTGNTNEILKKSQMVITINSTVGIEALLHYKPVVTLGKSYYNINEICYPCHDHNNLHEYIHKALNSNVKKDLINKFLTYLRFHYQVEGNWRDGSFNKEQLLNKINESMKGN